MQSVAPKYIKAIFVLKLTFSGGGVVGMAIRKCTIQRTKKTQNQLNTLYKLMLTILELADITEQLRPNERFSDKAAERTLLKQRKMYENL